MSTIPSINHKPIDYPTTDGKPMAETDHHRDVMVDTIKKLQFWYQDKPRVYVTGNLLLYYVPGNKRKHISPDVFVAFGVPKKRREYYLTWEEGKSPSMVTEITSKTTRNEDMKKKFVLYRDVLKVKEYFLFDPFGDYLKPQLQGYRLHKGDYVRITEVDGRLPSKVVSLHFEADSSMLQLYDPITQKWLPTPEKMAEIANDRADAAEERAKVEAERAALAEREKEALVEENKRLREEMEKMRRK